MHSRIIAVLFFCILSVASNLNAADDPFGSIQTREELPRQIPRFRAMEGQVSLDHFLGRSGYLGAYSQVTFDGFYYFPKKTHTLRLIQALQKKWEINSKGENEFDLQDTLLYYYYELNPNLYGFQVKLRGGATLPLSRASRTSNLITRTSATLQINHKFLGDTLTVGFWPFFNYYFNEYSTTLSGSNVRQIAFGNILSVIYHPVPKIEIQGSLTGSYTVNQKAPFATSGNPIEGNFEWDIYAGYEVMTGVLARIGYNHGNSFVNDGRYELSVFDQNITRFYIGADIAL